MGFEKSSVPLSLEEETDKWVGWVSSAVAKTETLTHEPAVNIISHFITMTQNRDWYVTENHRQLLTSLSRKIKN